MSHLMSTRIPTTWLAGRMAQLRGTITTITMEIQPVITPARSLATPMKMHPHLTICGIVNLLRTAPLRMTIMAAQQIPTTAIIKLNMSIKKVLDLTNTILGRGLSWSTRRMSKTSRPVPWWSLHRSLFARTETKLLSLLTTESHNGWAITRQKPPRSKH